MTAEEFQRMVTEALAAGVQVTDLAHLTGVNTSTVERWANGSAVPYVTMRPPVEEAIVHLRGVLALLRDPLVLPEEHG
jgi:hypothetical protein